MKVKGSLTHAKFIAEISRIIRQSSRVMAHETLRLHVGEFIATNPANQIDVDSYIVGINKILNNIGGSSDEK